MRIPMIIIALSMIGVGGVHAAPRFGTFKVKGYTFEISRGRLPQGRQIGPRHMTLRSRQFPGAQLVLQRKWVGGFERYDAKEVELGKSVGSPEALRQMTSVLGMGMHLVGSATGPEAFRVQAQMQKQGTPKAPEGSVLRRLIAMELGMKLPRDPKAVRRPRRPKTNRVESAPQAEGHRVVHVTEVAQRRDAVQGGVVYVDNYSVQKNPNGGWKVRSSDGSSVNIAEPWRIRRLLEGGTSNSYPGSLRHTLHFR